MSVSNASIYMCIPLIYAPMSNSSGNLTGILKRLDCTLNKLCKPEAILFLNSSETKVFPIAVKYSIKL